MADAATSGPSVQFIQDVTIDPASVAATLSVQTFTVKGLKPNMTLVTGQNQTWAAAGFVIVGSYCNAVDVLTLVFLNLTGSTYDAASASIHVMAI